MHEISKKNYFLTATLAALTLTSCNDNSILQSENNTQTTQPKTVTEIFKGELDDQSENINALDFSEGQAHSIQTPNCPEILDLTQALITNHSNEMWGMEKCRFRSVAKNQAIEVVLFTLEGQCWTQKDKPRGSCGNNYSRYMVGVFNGMPLGPIAVDKNSSFSAQAVAISENEIIVSGAFYQSGDGRCCPSKIGKRLFGYDSQGFVEINPDTDDNSK